MSQNATPQRILVIIYRLSEAYSATLISSMNKTALILLDDVELESINDITSCIKGHWDLYF